MTPLQMLRTILQHVSNSKLWLKGQQLQREAALPTAAEGNFSLPASPSVAQWQKHCEVVFLDGSGWRNLTFGMTEASLLMVSAPCVGC